MKGLRYFIRRCLVVIGIPLLVMAAVYVAVDPFRVIKSYPDYNTRLLEPPVNRGLISIRNFQRCNGEYGFNSFIFGSSLSINYRIADWKRHLPDDAVATHLDSSAESIHSLLLKMRYLKTQGVKIDNALVVLSPTPGANDSRRIPIYIDLPEIDPDLSFLEYHWIHLAAFYDRGFLRSYAATKIAGRGINLGANFISTQILRYTWGDNEEINDMFEDSIRNYPQEFYGCRPEFAQERKMHKNHDTLTDEKIADLKQIAEIIAGSDYHVVVGPSLSKGIISDGDKRVLSEIFGSRFHDFSASLAVRADCDTLWYDAVHYRWPLASEIMDSVYGAIE